MKSQTTESLYLENYPEFKEIKLIIEDQEPKIVSREVAETIAEEKQLDLVVVNPNTSPPIVKLMNYEKYKFEQKKKSKQKKKTPQLKELKFGIHIGEADYKVKLSKAKEFLNKKNTVKVSIKLFGRENQHPDVAFKLANRLIGDVSQEGYTQNNPILEGKQIVFRLLPR